MQFEIVNNWVFSSRENHVMTSSDRVWAAAWIFDCENQAIAHAAKLNKVDAKYGRVNAVACIIN